MANPSAAHRGWYRDRANSRLSAYYDGTEALQVVAAGVTVPGTLTVTGAQTLSSTVALNGAATVADDIGLGIGGSDDAVLRWETADANANALHVTLPAGDATNVPVIVVGQGAGMAGDLGLYNGVVDPRVALLGVGAVTTGPVIEMRKARGTVAAPTVCTTGDDIGQINFYGAVAAGEYVQSASIQADIAGTIATTRGPGTLTFKTATDAAPSVLTTALTLSAAQVATFASTVTVQGTSLTIGVAGSTVGGVILAGNTSGTVELRAQAAAGSIAFLLPAAVGSNGEQLATNGNAGTATLSWTAAASLREYKTDIEVIDDEAEKALERMKSRHVYGFKYNRDIGKGTGDWDTRYKGVMADEYPEVMHFGGRIVNPVNTFGEAMLAIKALAAKVERLEGAIA